MSASRIPSGGSVRRWSSGSSGGGGPPRVGSATREQQLGRWHEVAMLRQPSSDDDDVKFIAAVTPRGSGIDGNPNSNGNASPASARRGSSYMEQQQLLRRASAGGSSAARVRLTSGAAPSVVSAQRLRTGMTPPEHLVSGGGGGVASSSFSRSTIDAAAAPKVFTVFCAPSAGQLFTEMLAVLLKRDGHRWLPATLPEEGRRGSGAFARGGGGDAAAASAVCCNRLSGINLFLGEKLVAEKLIEEARLVGLRVLRGQPEAFAFCPHERWRARHQPPNLTPLCLVNYFVGLRSITLKSKMVKTLLAYHRGSWRELGRYLPRTHVMVPRGGSRLDEREVLVNAMCADNVEEFKKFKVEAGYWIAKPSHGAHGADIKIFFANQQGLDDLVTFMDAQEEAYQWVVSKYISRPLLYKGRKFDLRCWVLVDPSFQIYLHDELVMRTSSEEYDARSITTDTVAGRLANITNHCVQAEGQKYSMHEEGNELWKDTLARLVADTARALAAAGHGRGTETLSSFVIPQIENIVVDSLLAAAATMTNGASGSGGGGGLSSLGSSPGDLTRSFQVMGYDFILDETLSVWLLEINGAPGVAQRLLKQIVHDTLEIVVDPVFTSQSGSPLRLRKQQGLGMNGFTRIYPKE